MKREKKKKRNRIERAGFLSPHNLLSVLFFFLLPFPPALSSLPRSLSLSPLVPFPLCFLLSYSVLPSFSFPILFHDSHFAKNQSKNQTKKLP